MDFNMKLNFDEIINLNEEQLEALLEEVDKQDIIHLVYLLFDIVKDQKRLLDIADKIIKESINQQEKN